MKICHGKLRPHILFGWFNIPPPPHTHTHKVSICQGHVELWFGNRYVIRDDLTFSSAFIIWLRFLIISVIWHQIGYDFLTMFIFIFLQRNCHWTLPIKAADLPLHKTCFSVSFGFKFFGISDVSKGYCAQFMSNFGIQIYICAVALLRSQEFLFKMCTAYHCTFTTCFDTVCG